MERNITVISTKTNGRKSFKSSATTLGELKKDLDRQGVSYSGMTFFEGITKTEMKSDDSLLPTNVSYKGKTTNDLVFMLTAPQAKVRSGEMTRNEAYAEIKRLGLQQTCIDKFGKNMTQCKTTDLISLIESSKGKKPAKPVEKKEDKKPAAPAPSKKETPCTCKKNDEELNELMDCLKELVEPLKVVLEKISKYTGVEMPVTIEVKELDSSDVDDIIKAMKR
jgi:hypothetical protein